MINVSFLILNYNSYEMTINYIKHVMSLQLNCKSSFVIVDNFSSNEQLNKLSEAIVGMNDVNLIENPKNEGYAKGNNLGLRYIYNQNKDEIVFVCNNDIHFFSPDLINLFIEKHKKERNVFLGARMTVNSIVQNSNFRFNSFYQDMLTFFPRAIINRLPSVATKGKVEFHDKWLEVDWLNGSFFSGCISSFKSIDYFDEDTFLYCEERILGKRCKEQKIKLLLNTTETYGHLEGASTKRAFNSYKLAAILCESRGVFYLKYTSGLKKFFGLCFHRLLFIIFSVLSRVI